MFQSEKYYAGIVFNYWIYPISFRYSDGIYYILITSPSTSWFQRTRKAKLERDVDYPVIFNGYGNGTLALAIDYNSTSNTVLFYTGGTTVGSIRLNK
jgi:hypothetical protein